LSKDVLFLHKQQLALPKNHPFGNEYRAVICKKCSTLFADTPMTEGSLAEYYKSLAKYQDKTVGTGGTTNPIEQIRFQGIVDTLDSISLSKDIKILDIGCANGGLLFALKERGYRHLYGLDPSPVCAENVRREFNIEARAGTIDQIGAFEQKFDLILLSHVCEHLLTPKEALTLLREYLTDDGMVYVEVPNPEKFYNYETTPFQEFSTEHINHFGPKPLASLLRASGYSDVITGTKQIQTTKFVFYPAAFGIWKKQKSAIDSGHIFDENLVLSFLYYRDLCSWKLKQIDHDLNSRLPKEYAIWGAGQLCYKLLTLPALCKNPPVQIVDGNSTNWGRQINDLEIQSPQQLKKNLKAVLIANMISPEDIVKRLNELRPEIKAINLVTR
jgi:2-polyprenyl-3-methyl-5-hydroxy-6-metoxy-1,4-benzoquinol methylase